MNELLTRITNNAVSKKLWIALATIAYGAVIGDTELMKITAIAYFGIEGTQNVVGIVKNGVKPPVSTIPQEKPPKSSVPPPVAFTPIPSAPKEEEPVSGWWKPIDLTFYAGENDNAYLQWEQFEDMYQLDLSKFNPLIRYDYAVDIVTEGAVRLRKAWRDELQKAMYDGEILYPNPGDYDSYDATEQFKLDIMKKIPGCHWLNINMKNLFIAFGKQYKIEDTFDALLGKPIDWDNVKSIRDIARLGLGAVK